MVDYAGQELSENIQGLLILATSFVAFVVGYIKQSFRWTFYGWAMGTALAFVLAVPDWWYFNKNPVKWLSSIPPQVKKKGKKKKKKEDETSNVGLYVTMAVAGLGFVGLMMFFAARAGTLGPRWADRVNFSPY